METLKTHDIPAQHLLSLYPDSVLLDEDAEEVLIGSIAHVVLKTGLEEQGQVQVNGIAGYIVIEEAENQQEILFLEVDPAMRGKGLGSSLLRKYVSPDKASWVYPLDPIARAFFNKVREDFLPLLEIED